ncbi:MAG: rhodanese-like domain-containing protein [Rhodospirillales bacterium]|nr:rhodanese-like domain-containing protein [Rhodospirillales bacterium]
MDNRTIFALIATLAVVLAIRYLPKMLSGAKHAIPEDVEKHLKENNEIAIIDVRSEGEFYGDLGHVPGSINIPIQQIEAKLKELGDKLEGMKEETLYVVCRTDTRASMAARTFVKAGFKDVRIMVGGMVRWKRDGLSSTS